MRQAERITVALGGDVDEDRRWVVVVS